MPIVLAEQQACLNQGPWPHLHVTSPRLPHARKAVWFTMATVIGAISAFVDSIDSHIILQMIRESKTASSSILRTTENIVVVRCCIYAHYGSFQSPYLHHIKVASNSLSEDARICWIVSVELSKFEFKICVK